MPFHLLIFKRKTGYCFKIPAYTLKRPIIDIYNKNLTSKVIFDSVTAD